MNKSILMTTSEYQRSGGHNVVINNLSKEIVKLGYDVTIGAFTFKEKPPEDINNIEIKKNPIDKKNWQNRFDIIHNHETKLNYYSLKTKTPFIFHYHGIMGQVQKTNLQTSLKLCQKYISRIISVSDSALNDISEKIKKNISSQVIYNGVDNNFFNSNDLKDFRKGEQELIFVGNLINYKNVTFLVNMIKELKKQYPKIHLQIVGDGKEKHNLFNQCKKMKLENNIELVGKIKSREEIRSRYLSSDAYVSASTIEACPLPPLEAMACGLPVFLSNIPAHKELIEKSNGGKNFSLNEISNIGEKFSEIIDKKKELGTQAKTFAKMNDWENIAKKIIQNYKKFM